MNIIEKLRTERAGFVRDNELSQIIAINRLQLIDVQHFVSIIERDITDYIRDVSIAPE